MVFHMMAVPREDPQVSDGANVTATVRVIQSFTMDVTGSPPTDAHPYETRRYNITLYSEGNINDVIDLSYDQAFFAWNVTFDVNPVNLPAYSQVKVMVTFTVPGYTEAGEYDIAITGVSQLNSTVVANAHIVETVVEKRYGVSLEATSPDVEGDPGDLVWWQMRVGNTGNVEDTYSLTAFGLGTEWTYRFLVGGEEATDVTLVPDDTESVVLEVLIPLEFDLWMSSPAPTVHRWASGWCSPSPSSTWAPTTPRALWCTRGSGTTR
jgi:uncharacterized membrane protein